MASHSATERLKKYRGEAPIPRALESWRFERSQPPYTELVRVPSILVLPRAETAPGLFLVATIPDQGSRHLVTGLDQLRAALPWLSIVVRAPEHVARGSRAGALAQLTRHGAVSVPVGTPEALIRKAVLDGFDPATDLANYLRAVVPRFRAGRRERAVEQFRTGFMYDPEDDPELPPRQPPWVLVGRALGAAHRLQRDPEVSGLQLALEAHYSDPRTMKRALGRAFGAGPDEILGTVGWEWLIWRFLSGEGQGKAQRWDR